MHQTAEPDSTVCIIPWGQTPQGASHSRVMKTKYLKILRGVNSTTESDPVFFTPQSQLTQISQKNSTVCIIPQCASPCGVKLRNVHHTAESNCTWQSLNKKCNWSLVAFKGTIRKNPLRSEHFYHERKDLKYKSGFT